MSIAADSSLLANVPLHNREVSAAAFLALGATLPPEYVKILPSLLADVPDPDQALNLLSRLVETQEDEFSFLRALRRNPSILHYTVVLMGYSFLSGETLLRNPDLLLLMVREKYLDRVQSREEYEESFARYRSRLQETDISLLLARFKKREYVRILLRDALGIATLAEVTQEISALCDVLIDEAVKAAKTILQVRQPAPQCAGPDGRTEDVPFAVLSLGKLGGNEVNYSSDVDLLYIYGGEAEDAHASREYFIRLSQAISEILGRATEDGAVFRIDLRLRPEGGQGEPAVSLNYGLSYYREKAEDWELQALIKVRCSAGDRGLGRAFIRGVQPYVYRSEINFSAIKTALKSRERIDASRRHRHTKSGEDGSINVKLDHGGIRDIEFLVQCLQRVYGGEESWLRSGGTLFSLQKLHDKQHLSGREFHDLTSAYTFLRTVEHRLQVQRGQQLHTLPTEKASLEILARASSYGEDKFSDASKFVACIKARMHAVSAIYDRIVYHQRRVAQALSPEQKQSDAPEQKTQMAGELRTRPIIERRRIPREPGTLRLRRNCERFWQAVNAHGGAQQLGLASEAVERIIRIISVSDYVLEMLARSPELIVSLAADAVGNGLSEITSSGQELLELPQLKSRYKRLKLAIAADTVLGSRSIFDKATHLSRAVDSMVADVGKLMQAEGVAVLALGRLGTREFDLLSDADLIFLRSPSTDSAVAQKLVGQWVNVLGAYTREGAMFEADLRLRPHGREGEIVCTPAELLTYFEREAQPWEALTYTKLRFVAGEKQVCEPIEKALDPLLRRIAANSSFVSAIYEMRGKLELTHRNNPASKRRAGAFYDIDFLVAFLLLRSGLPLAGSTMERLDALTAAGVIPSGQCDLLRDAARFYRTIGHVIQVVTGGIQLPNNEEMLADIAQLLERSLGRAMLGRLQQEIEEYLLRVRALFTDILS